MSCFHSVLLHCYDKKGFLTSVSYQDIDKIILFDEKQHYHIAFSHADGLFSLVNGSVTLMQKDSLAFSVSYKIGSCFLEKGRVTILSFEN